MNIPVYLFPKFLPKDQIVLYGLGNQMYKLGFSYLLVYPVLSSRFSPDRYRS